MKPIRNYERVVFRAGSYIAALPEPGHSSLSSSMSFSSSVLSLERNHKTGILFLNRPQARNAMGPAFWSDFPRAVQTLVEDAEVEAIVVAGKGASFSVGLDLKSMMGSLEPSAGQSHASSSAHLLNEIKFMQQGFTALADSPKPVVAAVHGHCLGAGIDLISSCDMRLASSDAVFSIREVRMAIVADLGTLQRLTSVLNPGHLAELALTGRDFDAHEARDLGLVSRIIDSQEALLEGALTLASAITENSPLVVQGIKSVLRQQRKATEAAGLDYVALWNAAFLQSDDLKEAVQAFMEKRKPLFKGQ